MITRISGPSVNKNPKFTGRENAFKNGAEFALRSVEKKQSYPLLHKFLIKLKRLKMSFQVPNSQNPIFDRPIKEEISTVQRFGFDNHLSTREIIRNELWDTILLNHDTLHSGRLSEFELKKLLSNLTKPPQVNHGKLKELKISSFAQIQDDAYRGQSLFEKPHYIPKLKNAGIRRVIDLAGYQSYKTNCIDAGLEYKSFVIDMDFWHNAAFKSPNTYVDDSIRIYRDFRMGEEELSQKKEKFLINHKEESEKFIDKFIDFIETINKGNFYIGCSNGTDRTDEALMLNQYFNPLNHQFSSVNNRFDLRKDSMKDLYLNLTEAHKRRLKFTPEFEKDLRKKLDIH